MINMKQIIDWLIDRRIYDIELLAKSKYQQQWPFEQQFMVTNMICEMKWFYGGNLLIQVYQKLSHSHHHHHHLNL